MAQQHKCFVDLNKALKEKNTKVVTNLFDENQLLIWTQKIESKKRGRPACVICCYCPFCGEKIEQ